MKDYHNWGSQHEIQGGWCFKDLYIFINLIYDVHITHKNTHILKRTYNTHTYNVWTHRKKWNPWSHISHNLSLTHSLTHSHTHTHSTRYVLKKFCIILIQISQISHQDNNFHWFYLYSSRSVSSCIPRWMLGASPRYSSNTNQLK